MSGFETAGHALLDTEVPGDELLENLGGSSVAAPSRRTLRNMDEAIRQVLAHAEPRGTYRVYSMGIADGYVRVPPSTTLRSRRLAQALAPCHSICVFAVTLGHEVGRLVREAMQERLHLGVVLDAAASIAADATADALEKVVRRRAAEGDDLSWRFSPGYCDWALREQRKLFSLLPERPAGTTLSSDCLMSPRKSVSGVVGIGPAAQLERVPSPCLSCGRTGCDHRRV